jgi:hypothetical protein
VKERTNRVQGIKTANQKLAKKPEDANSSEGLGTAIGNFVKTAATHVVANGLGISASSVHQIARDLLTRKSAASPKPAAQKPAKPQHTQPAPTHSSTTWQPVEIHHVFSGEPSEHEHSLQQALHHHNIGEFAKSKGNNSKAELHFRARDKHFKNYVANAPRENLKKLDQGKVKSIFTA